MQTAIQNYPKFSFVPFKMSLMAYLICNIIWKLVLLMAIAGIVVLISTMSGYVLSLVAAGLVCWVISVRRIVKNGH